MMKKNAPSPIKVALFGMDSRSCKTMELYLKGPCRGVATVVDEDQAEIDILDADFPTAGEILQSRNEKMADRPIILLALEKLTIPNTYFLQKPVKAALLVDMLIKIRPKLPQTKSMLRAPVGLPLQQEATQPSHAISDIDHVDQFQTKPQHAIRHKAHHGHHSTVDKPVKRRSAMELNEGGYTGFLGTLSNIDFDDPEHLVNASFDPKCFMLGYIQSAYKVARSEARALQLQSMWKPVYIFPDRHQVWVDADEKHLRAMAGIEQNKGLKGYFNLAPFDVDADKVDRDQEKYHDMDAFLWKLALWASKGRLPVGLDAQQPVFLKCWPNFTRIMITPDAMRISALLAQGSRTPLEIVKELNVKPEYVFAFIAACHAIGILNQASRRADELVVPEKVKVVKKHGLLGKILSKLRGV